jgi:acyl-coenzyme A synthetase/AMP-(fatty) acid ligase
MPNGPSQAAVVGMDDELKGHVPFGFVVLNNGGWVGGLFFASEYTHVFLSNHTEFQGDPSVVVTECIALVREMVGPVASFKHGE